MSFVKYFDHRTENGKTYLKCSSRIRLINGRNGWLSLDEEYPSFDSPSEAMDLQRHFGLERQLGAEVILDEEKSPESVEALGRNQAIAQAEAQAGIDPSLLREMVWVEGAESTSGVIVLPHDDYARVYILTGDRENPQVQWVDEGEEGDPRPYYAKPGDGKTYIYVNGFSGGSGTQEDPYVITNIHELQAMNNNLGAHYVLGNDIDGSETVDWNDGKGFEPIAPSQDLSYPFFGSLDGRGHKIENLFIKAGESSTHTGLFSYMDGGVIESLHLRNAMVKGKGATGSLASLLINSTAIDCSVEGEIEGHSWTGGLFGIAADGAHIESCSFEGSVEGEGLSVGGIVGSLEYHSEMTGCSVRNANISGTEDYVGGLAGWVDTSHIESGLCQNITVTGKHHVGGAAGSLYESYISKYSLHSSSIEALFSHVGGAVGSSFPNSSASSSIVSCSVLNSSVKAGADGDQYGMSGGIIGMIDNATVETSRIVNVEVEAEGAFAGGVAGASSGDKSHISKCYSVCSVTASRGAGGLMGLSENVDIIDCFSLPHVLVDAGYAGVFIGRVHSDTFVERCYASGEAFGGDQPPPSGFAEGSSLIVIDSYHDADLSGLTTGSDAIGKSTVEMMQQSTFENWDFDNVWDIDEGKSYPWLRAVPRDEEPEKLALSAEVDKKNQLVRLIWS